MPCPSAVGKTLLQLSLQIFKGAPPARRARAEPAQSDRELKPRSAGEECVRECERDHLVLSGGMSGDCSAPVASTKAAPFGRKPSGAAGRRQAADPASLSMWLLAVTRSPAPR